MTQPTRHRRRTLLCRIGLHRMDRHEQFDGLGRVLSTEIRCGYCGELKYSVSYPAVAEPLESP